MRVFKTKKAQLVASGVCALLCVAGAVYVALVTYSPASYEPLSTDDVQEQVTKLIEAKQYSDMVIIPKIGVSVPFAVGDESVMAKGAWHRFPERGDPEKGGNFILSAHRFRRGWNPADTNRGSPFYNMGKLEPGDTVEVIFNRKHYTYVVSKKYRVDPEEVQIEQHQREARMTLYSCTLEGEKDGRDVIEARLTQVGTSDASL